MRRSLMVVGGAVLALSCGMASSVAADKAAPASEVVKSAGGTALPKPDGLKIREGTVEGHKSPKDVAAKAIQAAKDGKMDVLKACVHEDVREWLDSTTWYNNTETTNIKIVAHRLSLMDAENLTEIKQGTVGKYAVVQASSEKGMHLLRTGLTKGAWYLKDYAPEPYTRDFSAGLDELKAAVESGDGAKLKEYLSEDETIVLDFIDGVQEGADPYAMLAARLKKVIANADKPQILLRSYYSWTDELAFWFHSDAGDTFLVVSYTNEYDWKSETYKTKARIGLQSAARFHKDSGAEFQSWVSDWDWGD